MLPTELIKKIRRIEIRTSRAVNDALAGQYHSAFKGRGMEFEEVRKYAIGDDVRAIDWNVSARCGEPYIKVFKEERELTVFLLVDISGSQDFGTNEQRKRDLVTEIGATVAFSAIRNNDKVGLVTFTDRIERFVPPRKGAGHVLRVIRELLVHETTGRGTDLAQALEHLNRIQRRQAVVFVVSDFASEGWEKPLGIARRRHDVIPVFVRDRHEESLPDLGLVEFEDAETGRRFIADTRSRAWRERFEAARQSTVEHIENTLRRLKLDAISVRTGESFTEPLLRFFEKREARRSR